MQAFQWHGKPSLTATKLAFSRAGVLLFLLWISFFLPVLGSSNVSSRPPPGCTGTFSWMDGWIGWEKKLWMAQGLLFKLASQCHALFRFISRTHLVVSGRAAQRARGEG